MYVERKSVVGLDIVDTDPNILSKLTNLRATKLYTNRALHFYVREH